jgi:hypothetical protein
MQVISWTLSLLFETPKQWDFTATVQPEVEFRVDFGVVKQHND